MLCEIECEYVIIITLSRFAARMTMPRVHCQTNHGGWPGILDHGKVCMMPLVTCDTGVSTTKNNKTSHAKSLDVEESFHGVLHEGLS